MGAGRRWDLSDAGVVIGISLEDVQEAGIGEHVDAGNKLKSCSVKNLCDAIAATGHQEVIRGRTVENALRFLQIGECVHADQTSGQ